MGVLFLIFFIILIIALIAVLCICDESAERTDEIEPTITAEYLENEKARLARDAAARNLRLNMMAMEAERQLMDAVSKHSKDGSSQDRKW